MSEPETIEKTVPTTLAATSPPSPPHKPWYETVGDTIQDGAAAVGHVVATSLHAAGGAIESILPAVEAEGEKIISAELPAAAAFALDYLDRNKKEYGDKVAAMVLTAVLAKVPGLDLAASTLSPLIVEEFDALVGVLETELKTLGGTSK